MWEDKGLRGEGGQQGTHRERVDTLQGLLALSCSAMRQPPPLAPAHTCSSVSASSPPSHTHACGSDSAPPSPPPCHPHLQYVVLDHTHVLSTHPVLGGGAHKTLEGAGQEGSTAGVWVVGVCSSHAVARAASAHPQNMPVVHSPFESRSPKVQHAPPSLIHPHPHLPPPPHAAPPTHLCCVLVLLPC